MRKSLLVLSLLLLGAAPAFAHKKYHHHHHHHPRDRYTFHCDAFGCGFYRTKHRLNENCVYKPWKDKVICKY